VSRTKRATNVPLKDPRSPDDDLRAGECKQGGFQSSFTRLLVETLPALRLLNNHASCIPTDRP